MLDDKCRICSSEKDEKNELFDLNDDNCELNETGKMFIECLQIDVRIFLFIL